MSLTYEACLYCSTEIKKVNDLNYPTKLSCYSVPLINSSLYLIFRGGQ